MFACFVQLQAFAGSLQFVCDPALRGCSISRPAITERLGTQGSTTDTASLGVPLQQAWYSVSSLCSRAIILNVQVRNMSEVVNGTHAIETVQERPDKSSKAKRHKKEHKHKHERKSKEEKRHKEKSKHHRPEQPLPAEPQNAAVTAAPEQTVIQVGSRCCAVATCK